jgi:IS30 family transposase
MKFRERGLSIDAAARDVGVSRTAGRNWAKGYKTYRCGQVVGFVPALDRLEARAISARFLSGRADRDRRSAPGWRQRAADRVSAGPGAVDDLARAGPQRQPSEGLSPV